MAKAKIKHTITKKEWNKKHKDFKTTIDGTPYIMMYDDKVGTHLVPVKIVDESVNEGFYKSIVSDGGRNLFFAMIDDKTDAVKTIDAKTWITSSLMDNASKESKERVVKAILKNEKQFNKKVEFNMWAKKNNPKFEEIMDYFFKNNFISNITKRGIKVYESIEEAKRGEFEVGDFVHFKSANKTGLVRGIKGDKVTILTMKGNYTGDIKDIQVLYQDGVNEMDINDPILMKLRALQMKKNKEAAKKIDTEKENKNIIKIKALKKKRAEVMRDMEQEAEPEGGKIADRYGKLLNKIDNDIIKLGGNPMSESVNENDGVYFKSYTAAIEAARAAALKKGFEVDDDEMFTKVGMNSKRPSVGKTTRVSLELTKAGKPQRKMLHIQVYGMKNGYELNSYIN